MAIPVVKVSSEFLVNTQTLSSQSSPAIAGLGNGDFVVTWQDFSGTLGDANGFSIKAQIFAADGSKIGSEFLVDTQTASHQVSPTVAGLGNGGFVVTWQDFSGTLGDSSSTSIKAQLFATDGSKVGSEFLVDTQTASYQQFPTVTGLSNGGFVVTWQDLSGTLGDASGTSIKAQVFAADGSKVGSEFLVDTQTANNQTVPTVTGLGNGGFVVTWQDLSGTLGDASGTSIKAQVFAADGSKVGSEFLVDKYTDGNQVVPTITGLANGGFVVTWQDNAFLVGVQVFNSDGTKIGGEFQFAGGGSHSSPTVTGLSNGDFVVAWDNGTDIQAQVFAADGSKLGGNFLINTQTAGNQTVPKITALGNGGFAVTWQDDGGTLGDTSGTAIKAQVFVWDTMPPAAPVIANASVVGGIVNAAHDTAAQALSGTAEAESTLNIYLNGSATPSYVTTADKNGNWSVNIGHLADGSYSYTAVATDLVGNRSAASDPLTFVVDTVPPVLALTSIVRGAGGTATVSGTIDLADAGRTITLADMTFPFASNPTMWSVTTTADANGHWSISGVPVSVFSNSPAVYAFDAAGNPGLSQYVYTASWGNGAVLGDGLRQYVYGLSSGWGIANGAQQNVYAGGLADGAVIRGTQVVWGAANNTTIYSGTQFVWGSSASTTIYSGGAQYVGGTAASTTINFGNQTIYGGASASSTAVHGGSQSVYGTADQTTVDSGGFQYVYGRVTNTTINSGRQNIYADGIAIGTTVNAGNVQIDWGTAIDTAINGGSQIVWGSATGTRISGGVQYVGGTVANTTVDHGEQDIYSGGTASDTTINAYGVVHLAAGGSMHNVTFGAPIARLELAQSSAFSGTISGFQVGNKINLDDMAYDVHMHPSYVTNADHSGGTLTLSDGVHTATLALLGQYTAADFVVGQDAAGTYLATTHQAQPLLATPVQV
ncbi:autotransporter passenger strand-loop-strand repeat protein [Bradyrhizobium japonicum]